MRIVLQRVSRASVAVDNSQVASIGKGALLLVGIGTDDVRVDLARLAAKIADLRIYEDADGKMNLSLRETGGHVLAVSQFTLYADTGKGRRPSFTKAAPPDEAERIYNAFVTALKEQGIAVQTGVFGAKMEVSLVNDGPVTIIFDLATQGLGC